MSILQSETYIEDLKYAVETNDVFENLRSTNIFITGATGLICSGVIDALLMANNLKNLNIHIYAAVRDEEKAKKRFGDFPGGDISDNISFIKYDATKTNRLDFDADYIIHGASNAHPKAFVDFPVDTMLSNIFGIRELLDYTKEKHIKRIMYISSSEVYGKKNNLGSFKEDEYGFIDILNPRNAYASAKRASETLCASYYKQYGVDYTIVRPGHIYGPTASRTDSRVGSAFAYDAVEGKDIILKSDGKQIRSYCYVLDCATAIISVLANGKAGEAYNISNSNSIISIRELAELYAREGGVNVKLDNPTMAEQAAFNPMNDSSLDSTKIEELGWKGLFDSKTGTAHTIRILRQESSIYL